MLNPLKHPIVGKVAAAVACFGLICLVGAAMFMMLGHDPESFVYNGQAEILANYAYFSFLASLVLRLLNGHKTD